MPRPRNASTLAIFSNSQPPSASQIAHVAQASPPTRSTNFCHALLHECTKRRQQASLQRVASTYAVPSLNRETLRNTLTRVQQAARRQLQVRQTYNQHITDHPDAGISPDLLPSLSSGGRSCSAHAHPEFQRAANRQSGMAQRGTRPSNTNPGPSDGSEIENDRGGHTHHHHDGLIVIDLDEAVHGVYAATQQGLQAGNANHAHGQTESFSAKMAGDVLSSGIADVALGMTAAGAMLPLAALAIHGGTHEIRHADMLRQQLKERESSLQARITEEAQLGLSAQQTAISQVEHQRIRQGLQTEKLTRHVGIASTGSGTSIALKGIADIATTIGFGVKSVLSGGLFANAAQTLAGSSVATGVATGFALAGAWVLGPAAALFATSLGWFVHRKSAQTKHRLKAESTAALADITAHRLNRQMTTDASRETERFYAFMVRQAAKRLDFFRTFKRWNKAFLIGSGLYAASAVTKAVVVGLAAGGVAAAASNPVGAGIVLGIGLAGALAMAVASLSFFTGHDKQGRYSRAAYLDHPGINRNLLAGLAVSDDTLRFELSAATLDWLDARKAGFRLLLAAAAEACGKVAPHTAGNSLLKRLTGKTLKPEDLHNFLNSNNGRDALNNWLRDDLIARNHVLDLAIRGGLSQMESATLQTLPQGDDDSQLDALVQHIGRLDEQVDRLQSERERVRALSALINRADQQPDSLATLSISSNGVSAPTAGTPDNNEAATDFLKLAQDYLLPEQTCSGGKGLAAALLGDMHADTKVARGILFEAQLQATRVKQQVTASA